MKMGRFIAVTVENTHKRYMKYQVAVDHIQFFCEHESGGCSIVFGENVYVITEESYERILERIAVAKGTI